MSKAVNEQSLKNYDFIVAQKAILEKIQLDTNWKTPIQSFKYTETDLNETPINLNTVEVQTLIKIIAYISAQQKEYLQSIGYVEATFVDFPVNITIPAFTHLGKTLPDWIADINKLIKKKVVREKLNYYNSILPKAKERLDSDTVREMDVNDMAKELGIL